MKFLSDQEYMISFGIFLDIFIFEELACLFHRLHSQHARVRPGILSSSVDRHSIENNRHFT